MYVLKVAPDATTAVLDDEDLDIFSIACFYLVENREVGERADLVLAGELLGRFNALNEIRSLAAEQQQQVAVPA